jgi:hypothetical protein
MNNQKNINNMKKLALTFAIVLGLSFGAFAQGGGLFQYGEENTSVLREGGDEPLLPTFPEHGLFQNQDAGTPTPIGSGALLLIGFGAAYAAAKRRKE